MRAKVRPVFAKEATFFKSPFILQRGQAARGNGATTLQERPGKPARAVGGVEAGIDSERLGRAPARKVMNGGRRVSSNKKGSAKPKVWR